MVRIVHPEVGYADVMPESVPAWEESGWTLESPAEPEAAVAEDETNPGDDPDNQEVR